MARKSKRNTRPFIIILATLFICTIIINTLLFISKEKLIKETEEAKTKYTELSNELEEKKNEYNKLTNDITIANDIDNNIANLKKEYFANIKTLEDKILAGESDKKIAYLTFDDGPYYLTHQFLEILDRYNVLATFFTIGNNKETCFDNRNANCHIYNEEAKRGHTMGNHTYSHGIRTGLYSSVDSFITQVKKQEELIRNETGVTTNIVRFPGGSPTAGRLKGSIQEALRQNGYGWVDWTAATGDGGSLPSKDAAWNNFVNSIDSNIEVILMHDYNNYTLQILPNEIEYLREHGYSLFPLFYESNMVNK